MVKEKKRRGKGEADEYCVERIRRYLPTSLTSVYHVHKNRFTIGEKGKGGGGKKQGEDGGVFTFFFWFGGKGGEKGASEANLDFVRILFSGGDRLQAKAGEEGEKKGRKGKERDSRPAEAGHRRCFRCNLLLGRHS